MKSIETDVNAKKPEKPDMTRDDLEICQDHLEATVASEPTPKGLCTHWKNKLVVLTTERLPWLQS